jgi:hypothetical protein
MTKRFVVTAALICIAAALSAQSPPPPPSPIKSGQEKQSIGGKENRQAKNTVSPTPTPTATANEASPKPTEGNTASKSAPNSHIPSSEWNWSAINTSAVTLFTFVLMLVGVLQWISMSKQADYMRRGLPVSIKAARSARFSAIAAQKAVEQAERTTPITQRAVILIESINAEPRASRDAWYLNGFTTLIFTFKNYGATVAYDVRVKGQITAFSVEFPLNGAQAITIAPQASNEWLTNSLGKLTAEQFEKINSAANPNLMTYQVAVTYTDAFGKPHHYMQTGEYIAILSRFITNSSTSD